jgi:cytochrome b involved in lipid metabolism
MEQKKELIIGIIGSAFIIFLASFYSNQYQKQRGQINQIAPTGITEQVTSTTSNLSLTSTEIAKHNSAGDCWIIIQGSVYNATQYLNLHPGGSDRIAPFCGQDATSAFVTQGGKGSHSSQAALDLSKLKLGQLNDTINITNTNNQIKNDVSLIKSSGKNEENDDDD